MPERAATDFGDGPDMTDGLARLTRLTRPFNYLGLPCVAVPAGFDRNNMPIGMQLAGPPFAEARLMRIAAAFEADAGLVGRPPAAVSDPAAVIEVAPEPLLRIEGLRVAIRGPERTVQILHGVSADLARGEVLCLLGESGSGKSVTLRSVLRLFPEKRTAIEGRILFEGEDLLSLPPHVLSQLRGSRVSMIFQEPATAFDPVYTVGQQIVETIRRHEAVSHAEAACTRR